MKPGRQPVHIPVYVFPCRIQQGWGDVVEMGRAASALSRAGFKLYYVDCRQKISTITEGDRRTVRVDPKAASSFGFPKVVRIKEPLGGGRAIVLATWWGMTCRRADSQGRGVGGIYSDEIECILKLHGEPQVLTLSLEEFASAQDSRTATVEAFRQAGWDQDRIRGFLKSKECADRIRRFHDATIVARGGESRSILHLVGSLSVERRAAREFPFMVQTGPFGFPASRPARPQPKRAGCQGEVHVLWYASPAVSKDVAKSIYAGMGAYAGQVNLEVRLPSSSGSGFHIPLKSSNVKLKVLSRAIPAVWDEKMSEADLLIVGGSQSLADALRLRRPFLYFNGCFGRPGAASRAFRREKLLSLLSCWKFNGVSPDILQDLSDFADGRRMEEVLSRALSLIGWRERVTAPLKEGKWPPWNLPRRTLDGDQYLVSLATAWGRFKGSAQEFVAMERGAWHSQP